ncbi:FCRL5 protein, partial [Polypterus senegalus]|nr:Fc receptor-like protein 5 isoform X1 [Polypterus senegalus]MBN3292389.1 FCRL5 protein [Polypterus senegalus]
MLMSELHWIVWLVAVASCEYGEKLKVILKIRNQKGAVDIGDPVTLDCSIGSDLPGWRYRWYQWSQIGWRNVTNEISGDTYTIQSMSQYNSGEYWCCAARDDHPHYAEFSNAVTLTLQEKPKATLEMKNQRIPVSAGDTVTLDCSIEGGFTGWRYIWYKLNWTGGSDLLNDTTGETYTLQSVTQSDTGVYWCCGYRDGLPQSSEDSNVVILHVQEKLNVTLKMRHPKESVHIGDKVTLECSIEGNITGVRYRWYKWSWSSWLNEINNNTGDTFTIKFVTSSDGGEYWCYAIRADHPHFAEFSNAMTLTVQGKPKATLKLRNQKKSVSIRDNVTLDCSIQGGFTGWRYTWYKLNWAGSRNIVKDITGDTYTVQSVTQSDSGMYWCNGHRNDPLQYSEHSNIVPLIVRGKQNVMLKMKNQKETVYTGDNLTLECSTEGDLSDWRYRWYRWNQAGLWNELKNISGDVYMVQSVTVSDSGKYWCYAFRDDPPEYSEFSNAVTLTVKVDFSTGNVIRLGFSCLVVTVLLVLVSECFWIRVLSACTSNEVDKICNFE